MSVIITTLLLTLLVVLGSGIWVGLSLMGTGVTVISLFRDIPIDKLLPQYVFNILTTSELVALPLFVIMGEFLFRTKLSRALFKWSSALDGLASWKIVACKYRWMLNFCRHFRILLRRPLRLSGVSP